MANIQVANVAEKVIQNYKDDIFERFRVLYNFPLRPFQWEWMFLMDEYPDVLAKSCKRVGKSVAIQAKSLDENVIHPDEEEMVFAPSIQQAVKTRSVQNDIIERSPILLAYLKKNTQGKPIFTQSEYEFYNNSNSRCFGVRSNFEGFNATKQHIDEIDDISYDEFLRIVGRSIGTNKNNLPTRHRFSGVIWGKLNVYRIEKEWDTFVLPSIDVYQGLAGGWLDPKAVELDRKTMTEEEWLRTYCLIYVESRNFIWESRLHLSQEIGASWGLYPKAIAPGYYQRSDNEKIAFGLDMGAQGAGEDASDYSLQVSSMIGPYRRYLFGKTWPGTTDPETIIADVAETWRYFRPDGGYGDSLDANLIAQINDRLYELGLIRVNWRRIGNNEQDGWSKWAKKGLLTPLVNGGRMKHYFYTSLKRAIDNVIQLAKGEPVANVYIFPKVDHYKAENLEHYKELLILIRELSNLQAERSGALGYYKISRITKKIEDSRLKFEGSSKLGDDRCDALAMSNFYLDQLSKKDTSKSFTSEFVAGV